MDFVEESLNVSSELFPLGMRGVTEKFGVAMPLEKVVTVVALVVLSDASLCEDAGQFLLQLKVGMCSGGRHYDA